MTDRTPDNSELSGVPNAATSRMIAVFFVSLFALKPSPHLWPITPAFSVGRRKPGGRAGKKKATTLGNGAAAGLVSGTAKHQIK
jgi:hypothetical protein